MRKLLYIPLIVVILCYRVLGFLQWPFEALAGLLVDWIGDDDPEQKEHLIAQPWK